ncbi:hypothetical protein H4R35_001385 [Dimargaris xerosporica]|nr:hypothetical protein H4R35_001385 [Dimargaris xerosporica]
MADNAAVQTAVQHWQGVDLGQLQASLDQHSLQVVDHQRQSLQGRKHLAEQTKGFRRMPDDKKLAEVKPLLKAYQHEIDQLTARMKETEAAYLEVYKKLSDAPDPGPIFQQLLAENERLGQIELLESENKLLRKELNESMKAVSKLRSQESQSSKWKTKLDQYETEMESLVQQRVDEKEIQLRQETDDVIQHLRDREMSLQKQLSNASHKLSILQDSQDSAQAQAMKQFEAYDETVTNRLAEVNVLQSELDRATSRIVGLQATNDRLKQEMAALAASPAADTEAQLAERLELAHAKQYLDQEVTRLRQELGQRDATAAKVPQLEQNLIAKSQEVKRLQQQLTQFDDYDTIKRELAIMKAVEFSLTSWDHDDEEGNAAEPLPNDQSLEKLLLTQNKRLQSDLTTCKNALSDTERRYQTASDEMQALTQRLAEREQLVKKLEEDLISLQDNDHGHPETDSPRLSASHFSSPMPTGSTLATSSPLSQVSRVGSQVSLSGAHGTTVKNPMVQIVAGQRDRLKTRVYGLEKNIEMYKGEISDLKAEISTLKQDNIQLYEKIRYMQTYQTGNLAQQTAVTMPAATSTHITRRGPTMPFDGIVDDDLEDGSQSNRSERWLGSRQLLGQGSPADGTKAGTVLGAVTHKYRELYEAAKNPFAVFRERESQRHYRTLNPADKATLHLGKLLLTNKLGRTFLFGYTLFLHIYVTFLLYRSMTSQDGQCDALKAETPLGSGGN